MPDANVGSAGRLGFIGIGRMGLPMCVNLLRAGADLTVHNRTADRAGPLLSAGARWAGSPAELAASCDLVLTCLATVPATENVIAGPGGVLSALRPGAMVVDHGTIGPDTARRLAERAASRGAGFLDAPVSGGPEGARDGTLTIMAGGAEADFRRVEPVLRAYGREVARVGPIGSGSLLKLVNQVLTFVHGVAAAEALGLAARAGLDLAAAGAVLRQSFGQSRMLERTLLRVQARDFEAGAALRLYLKDLGLALDAGQSVHAPLPLTRAALAILQQSIDAGLADRDIASLYLLLRETTPWTS